ncbi:MAG TPA: Ku protein [Candidatus Methylacidiphilales bacterium]
MWKGALTFGLVTIPVSLYPATKREELSFRLLRRADLSPVNYKRVAQADGKEVPWEQIVKGYEYKKGKFVVLREEDFKRVDLEAAAGTIDILDFVEAARIDPVYFQKPYYLEPGKGGDKAYALLRDALGEAGKIGIAKVVIRTREHLAGVKVRGPALVLEIMHFADELADAGRFRFPKAAAKARPRELAMAKQLIDGMTREWDPARYEDEYKTQLMEMIEKRIRHPDKKEPAPKAPKRPANVIDLTEVLRQSLSQAQSHSRNGHSGKKARPHRRSRSCTRAHPRRKAA